MENNSKVMVLTTTLARGNWETELNSQTRIFNDDENNRPNWKVNRRRCISCGELLKCAKTGKLVIIWVLLGFIWLGLANAHLKIRRTSRRWWWSCIFHKPRGGRRKVQVFANWNAWRLNSFLVLNYYCFNCNAHGDYCVLHWIEWRELKRVQQWKDDEERRRSLRNRFCSQPVIVWSPQSASFASWIQFVRWCSFSGSASSSHQPPTTSQRIRNER